MPIRGTQITSKCKRNATDIYRANRLFYQGFIARFPLRQSHHSHAFVEQVRTGRCPLGCVLMMIERTHRYRKFRYKHEIAAHFSVWNNISGGILASFFKRWNDK